MSKALYRLEEVFQPRSVAILGASRAPQKWGHVAAKQLIEGGFTGQIYLINPSTSEILGRTTYPNLQAVPGPIDLAVIATSFNFVEQAV
ncbi:MAG TPA: CoA-binding protein, partial [Ktedonobacteraceae bacterium]